jgi:hypothetical protein
MLSKSSVCVLGYDNVYVVLYKNTDFSKKNTASIVKV